ncbi:MAG: exopolyphosphatase [Deltaproteobacteria bacterium]|nr:exopolyphosphatase [Deltaproteobacteria bacterium]
MRIVTRPDFDGVVCAVLLQAAEPIDAPTCWIEPNAIQKGTASIRSGDILANLPYDPRCSLWFDHHVSNRIQAHFKGAWRVAPSAAGVIYDFYLDRFIKDFSTLVHQADKIDAADLTREEVLSPERHPFLLLSMTISGRRKDAAYWDRLVTLLGRHPAEAPTDDPQVKARCRRVVEDNAAYRRFLLAHTELRGQVAVTDFRHHAEVPEGNRFLGYALFPQCIVQVRIRRDPADRNRVSLSVGHSIFNRGCRVNVGLMLASFGGGGHRGAGGCSLEAGEADGHLERIIGILMENKPNEA